MQRMPLAEFAEQQTLKFHNDRVKPEIDIYKKDIKTGELDRRCGLQPDFHR